MLRSRLWLLLLSAFPPTLQLSILVLFQVVPPRVTEPHRRPVPWDVRAGSVEAAVPPAEPYARVLFHLKGQDWPPGPSSLPCARLHATHPAGTAHQACRFQVSVSAAVPYRCGARVEREELDCSLGSLGHEPPGSVLGPDSPRRGSFKNFCPWCITFCT